MLAWKKSRCTLIALLVASIFAPATQADFSVVKLTARVDNSALVVNGELQLELSGKIEEAISKGIELPVTIELRLYRRSFFWNGRVESWPLRRGLRYHALSGQYIVASDNALDSFLSAADALKYLGTLSDLHLALAKAPLAADDDYIVKARVYVDIEALPAPLRPVAYTSLSWQLNSGWTTWNVLH